MASALEDVWAAITGSGEWLRLSEDYIVAIRGWQSSPAIRVGRVLSRSHAGDSSSQTDGALGP
jgi:hypothetical protein